MEKVILIKYGELSTKKGNRNFFTRTLSNNLKRKLENTNCEITHDLSRMCITFKEEDQDIIIDKINHVFGIHNYQIAYKVETNEEVIKNKVLEMMLGESFKTFKIVTKRSYKMFPHDSMEFSKILGGIVLKNIPNIKVDVHDPDITCTVEITKEHTYIYSKIYSGLGGYPVGTQQKGMLMLSGGIDSPVAGYLALKRGMKLDAVYFEAIPHTSLEARNKVINLTKELVKYSSKINLHVIPFTKLQEEIYQKCDPTYCITIMRRMMYRIMERMAKRYKGLVIVNGESIGQVASQTLTSMSVINSVTNMPVIRPVACLDKLEIIDIAKKINTYEISILPFEDCCTIFVPKHPVINPTIEDAVREEKNIDYDSLIDEIMENILTIPIKDEEDRNSEFEDLL